MKSHILGLAVVATALVLSGCYTYDGEVNHTATGALEGGAIGAGSGALLGAASGHAGAGALIGGAIGLVTGTIIGSSIDQAERDRLRAEYPQTLVHIDQGQPLGIPDIKALAKAGVNDDAIIGQIRNSRSVYQLSAGDIIDLKNSGVSEKVIDFMINTATFTQAGPSGDVATEAPPAAATEVVAQPPGPGYVWIDGYWGWYGNRWVWVSGYWAYPPRRHAFWVSGRWVARSYGWVWVPGHWAY